MLCALALNSNAQGVLDENHHYTLYRSWALAPSSSENPFKIIAYLPEGYLFKVLEYDSEVVSGSYYSRVLTQDGVEALLYTGAISDWTFRQAVGGHELIFNGRYQLCKTPGCEKNSESVWQVARSEAFKIIEEGVRVKISANRNGMRVDGYLSASELRELSDRGLVTRTDHILPRYNIKKSKSSLLTTTCGQQHSTSERIQLTEGDQISGRLIELLNMGEAVERGEREDELSNSEDIELARGYGGDGYLYSFYLYQVEDRSEPVDSEDRFFDVAAGFKISCVSMGDSGQYSKTYIDHMLFVNERNQINGKPFEVEISSGLFNTPRDIREYTGDAYMISINKPEHFERAIEILTGKIGDRTLAGYMLTELNRSCRSDMRVQYSGSVCRIYDY